MYQSFIQHHNLKNIYIYVPKVYVPVSSVRRKLIVITTALISVIKKGQHGQELT